MHVGLLQVVGVNVDLDELDEAEPVLADEGREASAECPGQQDIRRLPHRLVDFTLNQSKLVSKDTL